MSKRFVNNRYNIFIIAYFQGVCSSGLALLQKLETPGRHVSDKVPLLRYVVHSLPSVRKLWQKRIRGVLNANEFARDIRWHVNALCENLIHTAERDNFIDNSDDEGEFARTRKSTKFTRSSSLFSLSKL